jgi:hypothetical protein
MNEFENGIKFEGTEILIPWKTPIRKLKNFGSPDVVKRGDRIEFIWRNVSLLNGIGGNWMASFCYCDFNNQYFNKVSLYFGGDKISFEAYGKIQQHLLKKLGHPIFQREDNHLKDKEIKWQIGQVYIYLYLFEMHEWRLSLSIGIAVQCNLHSLYV